MTTIGQTGDSESALCHVEISGGVVRVSGPDLTTDRQARLFFGSLLGGDVREGGWELPPKSRSLDDLVIRVSRWLDKHGRPSKLVGPADESVQRDAQRRLSFQRAREAALELRAGTPRFSDSDVLQLLSRSGWNSENRSLRPHQIQAVSHGLSAANSANFSVPGSGKTASTLALASIHVLNRHIDCVLVVGPLSCFRPWEDEVIAAIPSLTTRRIRGTAQQRRSRIRSLEPGTVALISYASAAADYRQLIQLCKQRRVMLVADESHRIKRFSGGTWAPAVLDIATYAYVRVILSGTPMPQSGRDLYTQLNVMWPGRELTGPRQRFANAVDNDFGSVLQDVLPFVSRTPKSALGLRPPEFSVVPVEMTSAEAEIYRLVVANFRRRVQQGGGAIAAQLERLKRGRPIRLLQAATNPALLRSGTVVSADDAPTFPGDGSPTLLSRLKSYDVVATPPAKFVEALRIIREGSPSQKYVVWSTFVGNLDAFSEFLRRETDLPVFQVDGRVQAGDDETHEDPDDEPETREETISRFLSIEGKAVLITNPASCSESISLHSSCHNAIYLDRTYDCAQWLQSIDRIHRLGLSPSARVEIHVLVNSADGAPTADALVGQSLTRKERQLRELLEGAALTPFARAEDPLIEAEGDNEDLRAMIAYLLGES